MSGGCVWSRHWSSRACTESLAIHARCSGYASLTLVTAQSVQAFGLWPRLCTWSLGISSITVILNPTYETVPSICPSKARCRIQTQNHDSIHCAVPLKNIFALVLYYVLFIWSMPFLLARKYFLEVSAKIFLSSIIVRLCSLSLFVLAPRDVQNSS